MRFAALLLLIVVSLSPSAPAAEKDADRLARELKPLWACLSGERASFALSGRVEAVIDGKPQPVDLRLVRYDGTAFDLELTHAEYSMRLQRRAGRTVLTLPHHRVAFSGEGAVDEADHLAPEAMAARLIGSGTETVMILPFLKQRDTKAISAVLVGLLRVRFDGESDKWQVGQKVTFHFAEEGKHLSATADKHRLDLTVADAPPLSDTIDVAAEHKVTTLPRAELERTLARGLRRTLEILAPSGELVAPRQANRRVEHGELRWVEGQRVVLLKGTPEEIGRAHGELLGAESRRCIDSVLHAFGTVQTIRTGRWFRHDLDAAYARLSPHIPERHKVETRALAKSLGLEEDLVEALNVFPELFHCSGFAVFGKATADGKLYHGRVLDYMTMIGLQDAATTFIVAPEGKIPFANVGYASFVGSVSGMNDRAISLGEMGGHGEGRWDGAPMATLMRRALEECSTLDEVMTLWKTSPRTCEYFYVFADGKTNEAVGVAATPEAVQFIRPGEGHERLGPGIEDAVVLSAGERLATLRNRVRERYGQIDAEAGRWLMSRPVAMDSNLHNVLFVPADGVLYVANADHLRPAADRPYLRLHLPSLLESMGGQAGDRRPEAGGK